MIENIVQYDTLNSPHTSGAIKPSIFLVLKTSDRQSFIITKKDSEGWLCTLYQ
ncbi:hypothetical protein SAMN05443667_12210 [Flavobacterium gillisiae]|uniref:Uncharacterized protein n=1 Tax=Flavobacterium gillisiae TaxID=150146 RepID=A0A1H4GCP8_9FLAO|nr:hypothetical protein SAMN05443667_12210 [Flavobacterium gillisiae]